MNLEQLEAFVLDQCQSSRLFQVGDYVLSQEQILSLVQLAYMAGQKHETGETLRRIREIAGAVA